MTDVVLQHPARSRCPRCGCFSNCQNLTVSIEPGLLDSVVGVRGSFISEPSAGEKGGETHPAGKKVACGQGARLGALAWRPLLSSRYAPVLTLMGALGVSCHPDRLQHSRAHGCCPPGRHMMKTWLRFLLLLCVHSHL